jgi:hypothetical protein
VTATTAWTPLAPASALSPVGTLIHGVTEGNPLRSGTSYCVRARARSDRDAKRAEIVSDWKQIGELGHSAFTYPGARVWARLNYPKKLALPGVFACDPRRVCGMGVHG